MKTIYYYEDTIDLAYYKENTIDYGYEWASGLYATSKRPKKKDIGDTSCYCTWCSQQLHEVVISCELCGLVGKHKSRDTDCLDADGIDSTMYIRTTKDEMKFADTYNSYYSAHDDSRMVGFVPNKFENSKKTKFLICDWCVVNMLVKRRAVMYHV